MVQNEASLSDAGKSGQPTQAHEIALAVRNALKLGSSLLLTWSVALIVKLQVPSHLGPVRQGHFGFAESFAGMFFTAIGLGIDTYVMKEVSVRPKHASDFVGGIFALRSLMSIVLFAAMLTTLWVTGRPREIALAVVVFGLAQFVININATLSTVLQATTKVGKVAVANVAGKVIWGIGLLLGLHFNVALWVLALPLLAAEILKTAVLVPAARLTAGLRYRIDAAAVKLVVVASLPFFVSGMVVGLGNNFAMSALEFMRRDEREVGWFAATQNLGTLTMLLSPLLFWVVMPMLSRAYVRSEDAMMTILRRAMDGLVILIAPLTVGISVGSDVLVKLAFGEKYAPAATGLSILSLVFVVTYINMALCSALVVMGRSWSVSMISMAGIGSMAGFMIVFVPVGRAAFHVGGECAGATMAVIANEACVIAALLSRFRGSPLDARNIQTIVKTVVVAVVVIVADRFMRPLVLVRLGIDAALYAALALASGLVRIRDVRRALQVIRTRDADTVAGEAA